MENNNEYFELGDTHHYAEIIRENERYCANLATSENFFCANGERKDGSD